jgi:hypothetical protein
MKSEQSNYSAASGTARPQMGEDAESPGRYELVVLANSRAVDPGGEVHLDIYVTGYGNIRRAKIGVWPNYQVFDEPECWIRSGLTKDENGDLSFDSAEIPMKARGGVLGLIGMKRAEWEIPTLFYDVAEGALPIIATEIDQKGTMTALRMRTKRDAEPGVHAISIVMTYFNGREWATSQANAEFLIRNFYQRHETVIVVVTAIATLLALFH